MINLFHDGGLLADLAEIIKSNLKKLKGRKVKINVTYISAGLLVLLSLGRLLSKDTGGLTLEEKQKATSGIVLFNFPGIADDDYYVHQTHQETISPGDYLNFSKFRMKQIGQALVKADITLKSINTQPFAENLFPLFQSDKKDQYRLLTSLMDSYYINVVERLDLENNKYTVELYVSKTAGRNVDNAITYLSKEDPCINAFLQQRIVQPLQTNSQVQLSFSEFRKAMSADCPHSHSLINLVSHDCQGRENCSNLYFSRGAYEINSLSIKMLEELSNLIREMLPRFEGYGLSIQVEGFADATQLKRAIPVKEGVLVSNTGTYLDGRSGRTIHNITTNDELSFVRAENCWKYLLERLAGTSVAVSYTGRGVTTANSNSDENRIVKIIISKRR